MASAQEQLNGYTGDMFYVNHSPESFNDYYHTNSSSPGFGLTDGHAIYDPNSALAKIYDFFTGKISSTRQAYENYVADWEFQRNKEQAAYETWLGQQREDNSFQRQAVDIQKAGFNPAMALISGGSISNAPSSAMETARYKRASQSKEKNDDQLLSSALKILALIMFKKL